MFLYIVVNHTKTIKKIMKKILVLLSITACVVWIYACKHQQTGTYKNYYCGVGSSDTICPDLPFDVIEPQLKLAGYTTGSINLTDSGGPSDSAEQTPLDLFSWQTFVALNWPSNAQGAPTGSIFHDDLGSLRVWEHFEDPLEVFNHPEHPLMLHLNAAKQSVGKFFYMTSKSPRGLLQKLPMGSFDEADGLPLVDRNLNYTIYEIKLNHVEDTFITTNKLNSVDGIYDYNHSGFQMPRSDSLKGSPGTIEIKAAWRILTAADDTSKYYCRNAVIYVDSLHTITHKPLLIPNVKVGLVGLHIIRNTPNIVTNMIWSTFEHIDNDPDSLGTVDDSKKWSYYNAACTNCSVNTPPPHITGDNGYYIWDTVQPYASFYRTAMNGYGTQVKRVNKVYKFAEYVNANFHNKLKGTVWVNYKLVGTQWEMGAEGYNKPAPPVLANTVQETYLQSTSSCIGCHNFASVQYIKNVPGKTPDTINVKTGMSFIFPVYAHPQKK